MRHLGRVWERSEGVVWVRGRVVKVNVTVATRWTGGVRVGVIVLLGRGSRIEVVGSFEMFYRPMAVCIE
jgi:hypothetical protein